MSRTNEKKMNEKKKNMQRKLGWATAHFPVLVAIQCVVSRQAGPGRAPGRAWPGTRPSRRVGASGSSARHGAAIWPSARNMTLYRDTILCHDRGQ